jgi:hypothetical protein
MYSPDRTETNHIHIRTTKLLFHFAALLGLVLLFPQLAGAHHGWAWAEDEEYEITGKVVEVSLGNPHGEVTIEVENEEWLIQVGQPWRNDRAGLTESILSRGVTITVHGHRSVQMEERVVKAERVVIDGVDYTLYPERES